MHGADGDFGTKQVGRSHLHAGRTKRQGGRDAVRVRDAAGGDDRRLHGFHDLWHEGERANLGVQILRQEHAPMAARLEPLRDDRIDPVRFEPACLVNGGRRGEDLRNPRLRTRASNSAEGKPK